MSLVLIAGHGGRDPGTSGGGHVEREVNIDVVLSVNDALSRDWLPQMVDIYIAPATDPRTGQAILIDRIAALNALGPHAVAVDVHHNANAAGSGAQVWISQRARTKVADRTWQFAPPLALALGALVGEQVPIITSDRSRFGKLGILDDTLCTALLVEVRNLAQVTGAAGNYAAGAAIAGALAGAFAWSRKRDPGEHAAARLARAKEHAAAIVAL